MTQEEIFNQVYQEYKHIFPDMLHASGGLPDTKGPGTSDIDISVYRIDHANFANHFPNNTKIDTSDPGATIYSLGGYQREVNLYVSNKESWNHAVLHRNTQLALRDQFPDLYLKAFNIKKDLNISTEEAWAKVLNLGDDFSEILLDTEKTLEIAENKF